MQQGKVPKLDDDFLEPRDTLEVRASWYPHRRDSGHVTEYRREVGITPSADSEIGGESTWCF
jgi:hypothetical protein